MAYSKHSNTILVITVFIRLLYQFARGSVTKQSRLSNRNLFPHSSEAKSEIKVLTELVSSEASLFSFLDGHFLCLYMLSLCKCLCPNLLLYQVRATQMTPFYVNCLFKDYLQTYHFLEDWGLGHQHMNLGGNTVQPITSRTEILAEFVSWWCERFKFLLLLFWFDLFCFLFNNSP